MNPLTRRGMLRTRSNRPHKKLEAANDALWSHLVLYRDEKCLRCYTTYRLEAHHFQKRRFTGTRWVKDNGFTLCGGPDGCHAWAESHPQEFEAEIATPRIGFLRVEQLKQLANVVTPRSIPFMEAAMAELQRHLQVLQKQR